MRPLSELADFLRTARRRLRFGELSRAPIDILRVEVRGDIAECDWMARPPDAWDAGLPPLARAERTSRQALVDAMTVRAMVFDQLSSIGRALLRGFRVSERDTPEVIIAGRVAREDPELLRIASLVMRAKLCGFQFELENGSLKVLQGGDRLLPTD